MENTLENRGKFLQNYAGIGIVMICVAKTFQIEDRVLNGILLNDKKEQTLYLSKDGYSDFYAVEEWQASLKPLSSITDQDGFEIANILEIDNNAMVHHGKLFVDRILGKRAGNSQDNCYLAYTSMWACDYLRYKGYALPYMGLSVDKLIDYGWIKLIE